MIARATTKISRPASNSTICSRPPCITSEKTILDIFISSINCGIISGNPIMAISAAFCCALAAMADKKVNTRLRLMPPSTVMPRNWETFYHRVTKENRKQQPAGERHQHHQQQVEQQFGNNKMPSAGNGIEVKHASLAFCQEAFGHRVYTYKQLDHPEKPIPYIDVRLAHGQVKYKDGGRHIEQYTIETVLLAYLQQQVFFEQGK